MELGYPILIISEIGHIEFIRDYKELVICNKKALKNGFYNNLTIIDCNSLKYKIKYAEIKNTVGKLWGFNLFKGQQFEVNLNFYDTISVVELFEFKITLIKHLKKDISFWDSDGNFDTKINFINCAKSIKEILIKLTNDFHMQG